MHSWVFRNRSLLEQVYGVPGRPRPLTEPFGESVGDPLGRYRGGPARAAARAGARRKWPTRLVLYHLRPHPRRDPLQRTG